MLNRLVKISLKKSNSKVPKWIFEIRVKCQNFGLKLKFFPKKKRNSNKKAVKHKSGLRQQLLYIFTTLDTDRFFLPIFWNVPVSRDPCWRPAQSFSAHFTTDLCVWLTDTLTWFFALAKRAQKKIKKNKNFRGPRRPLFYFLVLSGTRQKSLWFCVCRVCKGWRLESAASRKVYVCIVINRIFYKWTL